ncbi:MAG: recombinase family protein [Terricaulis sp.]
MRPNQPKPAVIYTRVSSRAQVKRGDGLASQETRCRETARTRGYEVVAAFSDDKSGALIDRPGMKARAERQTNLNASGRPVGASTAFCMSRVALSKLRSSRFTHWMTVRFVRPPSNVWTPTMSSSLVATCLAIPLDIVPSGANVVGKHQAFEIGATEILKVHRMSSYLRHAGHPLFELGSNLN